MYAVILIVIKSALLVRLGAIFRRGATMAPCAIKGALLVSFMPKNDFSGDPFRPDSCQFPANFGKLMPNSVWNKHVVVVAVASSKNLLKR
ncbi:hypothetical protein Hdeb2414_s0973g00970021 [Helianthus debilis subsp. tardiflorus]